MGAMRKNEVVNGRGRRRRVAAVLAHAVPTVWVQRGDARVTRFSSLTSWNGKVQRDWGCGGPSRG